jgi:hypothetical protein
MLELSLDSGCLVSWVRVAPILVESPLFVLLPLSQLMIERLILETKRKMIQPLLAS